MPVASGLLQRRKTHTRRETTPTPRASHNHHSVTTMADTKRRTSSPRRGGARATEQVIAWRDLRAELVKPQRRTILDDLSGQAYNQRVLAILGPSGSGKSTLLQALSGRLERSSKLRLSGSITPDLSRPAAFVYQDDAVHARLTVEETMRFAGALRLRPGEVSERVASALASMNLQELAGSLVGNAKKRGISGGEKKRLAIGCALLSEDPHAPLYADEPTSGLDSFQARNIAEVLHASARGGRAVLLSVHQPSSRLLESFDDTLLLSGRGATLYCGPTSELMRTLEELTGLSRPLTVSTAEWALDLASVDQGDADASRARLGQLASSWARAAEAAAFGAADAPLPSAAPSPRSSWAVQLVWCLWRSWKQSASISLLVMRLVGTVMPALCFGLIWWSLAPTTASLRARVGLLQVLCNFAGVTAAMKAVRTLQDGEALCVRRERAGGSLRLSAYFLGKILAELPANLALASLLAVITHVMSGLHGSVTQLALLLALETIAAGALGLFAGAASPTLDIGLETTKSCTTLSTVFGGMYFDASTLPWALRWVPRTSIVRLTWDGMMRNEMDALEQAGIAASAGRVLADNGVTAGGASAAVVDLLTISAVLLGAAFLALVAKAPRFEGVSRKTDEAKKMD